MLLAQQKNVVAPSLLWIRIRIDLVVLDPYWECGTRSGSSSMEIYQINK
jgi:hypothetical protein